MTFASFNNIKTLLVQILELQVSATMKIVFIILYLFLVPVSALQALEHPPHILLLNSYHEGYKGTDDIVMGFRQAVLKSFPEASIKTEYLDSKFYRGEAYQKKLNQLLFHKYTGYHFDLVFASDDFAFNFLEQHYDQLYAGLPAIFCGTNSFDPERIQNKELFYGLDERPSFKETIELMLKIHPDIEEILVIHDASITGKLNGNEFQKAADHFSDHIHFRYLVGKNLENLINTLTKGKKKRAAIYFASFVHDNNGILYSSSKALQLISKPDSIPIYGGWEFSLNHGIVGGKLIRLFDHGYHAGELAVKYFSGELTKNFPKVLPSPNTYMFDDLYLKRFQISDSMLPENSLIINRPPGFYEKNKINIYITLSILLFIAVTGAMIFLFFSKKKLKKTLSEVKTLQGFIAICSYCKNIRTDQGAWQAMERYVQDHSDSTFSHGICPKCYEKEMKKL